MLKGIETVRGLNDNFFFMATELPQKIMIKVRHKWVTTSEPSKRVVLVGFINNHNTM